MGNEGYYELSFIERLSSSQRVLYLRFQAILFGKNKIIFFLTNFTLQDQYSLEPVMVVCGVKMIYVPWMPGHKKRLTQT